MLHIRKAGISDVPAITEIYNEAVLNTTATFDTEPRSLAERMEWFAQRDENFPIYLAEKNSRVAGYISLNRWSTKRGYDCTAELSLYIRPEFRGDGMGRTLLEFMLAEATQTNLHSILARITQENEISIHLHKSVGFEVVGHLKEAGFKFNRFLDVTLLQKMLRS